MQQLDTIFSRESEILMGVAFTFMSFTGKSYSLIYNILILEAPLYDKTSMSRNFQYGMFFYFYRDIW